MDDLTLMRSFGAERVKPNPAARAAARRVLDARLGLAAEAVNAPASPPAPVRRLRLPSFGRRRPLALAGATALAAALAGVVVLSSGPTAQPASAEILHRTAAVAAASDAPAAIPGPGQFLYRKVERLQLQSWVPGGESMLGGTMTRPGAFTALVPTTQESWTGANGGGRTREVAGTLRFLDDAERSRWEAAGSRLPAPFDPEYQRKYPLAFSDPLELRRGVVDWSSVGSDHEELEGFRFPDTSELPTDPAALRRAVETNQVQLTGFNLMYPGAKQLDTDQTVAELFNILQEGNPMRPQLRAAIFNALAELPGIQVDTEAADFLGRRGDGIRSFDPETGGGTEFVFDPETSEVLAQREFLGGGDPGPFLKGLPAGFTIRETAYLQSDVVDSSQETAAEGG